MEFFTWHYGEGLRTLLEIGHNYLVFIFHLFSTTTLLRTLLSPWKRLYQQKTNPGFNLQEFFERVSFNAISRGIGFIARLILIFCSLLTAATWLIVWLVLLILWIALPPIFLPWYWLAKRDKALQTENYQLSDNKQIKTALETIIKSPRFRFIVERLGISSQLTNLDIQNLDLDQLTKKPNPASSPHDLIKTLWETEPQLKTLAKANKIESSAILSACNWYDRALAFQTKQKQFWKLENLGYDLAYGYTPTLDRYAVVMSDPNRFYQHLVGRSKAVSEIERTLTKQVEGNIIMLGEPGVGKRTVVYELAKKIYEGHSLPQLKLMRVLELDIVSLLTSSDVPASKATLKAILQEAAAAGNIILVINNIDNHLATGDGRSDLSEVIIQGLTDTRVRIIGITTPENYHKYIKRNAFVAQHFEAVEINAPTKEEAIEILQDWTAVLELRHKVFILQQTILETIEKSDKLISETPFPEKAIKLLEETAIYTAQTLNQKVVLPDFVDELLSQKLKIPLGELTAQETDKLKTFDELIHKRIVGQDEAVQQLAMSLRRTRLGTGVQKTLGTFLFLGPTGVGKTETAKVLAQSYFGNLEALDRLDMAQFQGTEAIERLIGSITTQEPGRLVRMLSDKPFGVLLIDEIEKAPQTVNNLFLTVLDEGYLTDAFGKKISVANKLIIATSNAGSEFIREKVNEGMAYDQLRDALIEFILKEKIFSPEFINRFEAVVVYKPLTKDQLREIARILLGEVNGRLQKEHEISVKITDRLLDQVTQEGYDPQFGARHLQRAIARLVEDQVARKILNDEVIKGEEIEIP